LSGIAIARALAYAEFLRSRTTPIVGTLTIPLAEDLMPGQLIHVHAKKKSDGTYRVDDDFRVTKILHTMSSELGYISTVDVARTEWQFS